MPWTKPEFEEVCLAMEVTAYVNTDAGDPTFERAGVDVARSASDEVDQQASSLSVV